MLLGPTNFPKIEQCDECKEQSVAGVCLTFSKKSVYLCKECLEDLYELLYKSLQKDNIAAAWAEAFWEATAYTDTDTVNRCLHHAGLPILEE